ncbi:hypothetical protein C9F11_22740 [Streptomyces sp. YIM 121038]|nr:hypothetical protein C9F11_22740 [Streptomyces sp. YIM 121038]
MQAVTLLPLAPAADDEALTNMTILAMLAGHPHPLASIA